MQHEQVILTCPNHVKPFRNNRKTISIDRSISETIKYLWNNGVITLGCCCGDGIEPPFSKPSIVIHENYHDEDINQIKKLISAFDSRKWDIFKWEKKLEAQ